MTSDIDNAAGADKVRQIREKIKAGKTQRKQGKRSGLPRILTNPGAKSSKGKLTASDITKLIKQLANLLVAGIPLVQGFALLAEGQVNVTAKQLMQSLQKEVATGHSLTAALRRHPKYFDPTLCSLVGVGEQSGALTSTLLRIVKSREKLELLHKQIRSSLTYPSAVVLVAIAITWLLLVKVVPQFEAMFQGFGADLPTFTRLVVDLSRAVQAHWLKAIICTLVLLLIIHRLYSAEGKFRTKTDQLILRLPVICDLVSKTILANYARTLATTINAGAPLVATLRSMAGSTGNKIYQKAISRLTEEVDAGQSLHLTMRNSKVFPSMITQMVAIGEETGNLAEMLDNAAEYYEMEVELLSQNITRLIEPVVMCILGLLTGGLIVAMYLPIFSLGGVLGSGF